MESCDNLAAGSLNSSVTHGLKERPGSETGSSRQGEPPGLWVNPSSSVGHRFDSVVGNCTQQGISSPPPWSLSDLLVSCRRDEEDVDRNAEGLLSLDCSDIWWSLGKGCDLLGWTDSLAQCTKDKSSLVCNVDSEDIHGDCSPGDEVSEDRVPSADGSSWPVGTEGPDG